MNSAATVLEITLIMLNNAAELGALYAKLTQEKRDPTPEEMARVRQAAIDANNLLPGE